MKAAFIPMLMRIALMAGFSFGAALPAIAHEFWIQPKVSMGAKDEVIAAEVRVGQNFNGQELYYFPSEIIAAKVTDASGETPIERVLGDVPIFKQQPKTEGLQVLSYVSKPSKITYEDDGKFEKFLKTQALDGILERHKQRGLPKFGFTEAFSRYAKALVTRGGKSGSDKPLGLTHELVALANPYELNVDTDKVIKVQVLFEGKPRANAQIKIFERNQTVTFLSTVRTGDDGIAEIPLSKNTRFMLSSVKMVERKPDTGVVWESLWANLTFEIDD